MKHEAAIALLQASAETCERNAAIKRNEGDPVSARCDEANAMDYRQAIKALQQ